MRGKKWNLMENKLIKEKKLTNLRKERPQHVNGEKNVIQWENVSKERN